MKWKIPVYWTMMSYMEVEAPSLEDAINYVESPDIPLPEDGTYVEDSFAVDYYVAPDLNKENIKE